MVKAKVLKTLRKKIEKAYRLDIPSTLGSGSFCFQVSNIPSCSSDVKVSAGANDKVVGNTADDPSQVSERELSIEFSLSSEISADTMQRCMDLFERNMGEMYSKSSWGLDLDEKLKDLSHKQSRFLLVFDKMNENSNDSAGRSLVAFLNFRFCLDDDEHPECAVFYVYELQVEPSYRNAGIGRHLMDQAETLAAAGEMDKTILTVFVSNSGAMEFYKRLGYCEDESSPRQNGDTAADYEILSKKTNRSNVN